MSKRLDPDQGAAYLAEFRLRNVLDNPGVAVFGSVWPIEPEVHFGDLASVQRYVDAVLAHVGCTRPIKVVRRRGTTKAHMTSGGTLALPDYVGKDQRSSGGSDRLTMWAMRDTVVLHEVAHHLAPVLPHHGQVFRDTFVGLLHQVGKPVTANLLAALYDDCL